jgi:hypothetical protein
MGNELRRRLSALERHAASDPRLTPPEIAAGIARYSGLLANEPIAAGIPSADAFGVMVRQMTPWMARVFVASVEPGDMLL